MNTTVIYASHFGNTQKLAEAIAAELRSLGTAEVLSADEAPSVFPAGIDLLLLGSPTEGHRMTPPMLRFFARLQDGALRGVPAAAFDTRLHWPRWLSGSAALVIARRLQESGADVIAPARSFFVGGNVTAPEQLVLEPLELDRAAAWAASVAGRVGSEAATATAGGPQPTL